jgi:hypothetical protein
MLGIGVSLGALSFLVGLVMLGVSGSRTHTRSWIGPAGTALTTLGLVIVGVSAVGGR